MVFIIRPYAGFTCRLRDSCLLHPTTQRVLIDGPYGETQPLQKYDNILFIVGGAGITVPLSYLDLLLSEDSITTSIRIVWAVREHKFLTDAIDADFRGAVENEKVHLNAFVTKQSEMDKDDENLDSKLNKRLRIRNGRPNVDEEVEEAIAEAGHGSLAVVACGPGMMADDTRRAVVTALAKGRSRVEYFEESFNW